MCYYWSFFIQVTLKSFFLMTINELICVLSRIITLEPNIVENPSTCHQEKKLKKANSPQRFYWRASYYLLLIKILHKLQLPTERSWYKLRGKFPFFFFLNTQCNNVSSVDRMANSGSSCIQSKISGGIPKRNYENVPGEKQTRERILCCYSEIKKSPYVYLFFMVHEVLP